MFLAVLQHTFVCAIIYSALGNFGWWCQLILSSALSNRVRRKPPSDVTATIRRSRVTQLRWREPCAACSPRFPLISQWNKVFTLNFHFAHWQRHAGSIFIGRTFTALRGMLEICVIMGKSRSLLLDSQTDSPKTIIWISFLLPFGKFLSLSFD